MVLSGYPSGSAAALLAGDLHLRYCSARFAWKLPTRRLPDRGRVRELVTEGVDGALLRIELWETLKEFDSTEKHQHTLHELGTVRVLSLVPRFGRDCGFLGLIGVQFVILMCCMSVIMVVLGLPWVTGLGLGSLRLHWPTSPGLHEGCSN